MVVSLAIGLGVYYMYMKQATPAGPATVVTQIISTTGVEMDLTTIGHAERSYFAQNGSYGTLEQMTTSGDLTMTRTGRDGYTYTVDVSSSGFTATAKWSPSTAQQQALHYPTFTVDQTYEVHQLQ
jgi:hypothetical protein